MKAQLGPILIVLALVPAADPVAGKSAEQPDSWCGSTPLLEQVLKAREDFYARRDARLPVAPRVVKEKAEVGQSGDIALIEADDSLVGGNPFDLEGAGVRFRHRAWGYRIAASAFGFEERQLGRRLDLEDDDSVAIRFRGGFRFPFFDSQYDRLFVNSDGNVTFGRGDTSLRPRDLQRFLAGPPRIAALLADLDPSAATADGGVFYRELADRVQITWLRVPRPDTFRQSSAQLTLFRDGQIVVAFLGVDPASGIVGISPGEDAALELLDLSQDLPHKHREKRTAIGEELTPSVLHDTEIGRAFFEDFRDDLDFLIVWLDFPQDLGGAFAYHSLLQNEIEGIGASKVNASRAVGSSSLESFIVMGSLANYPDDLDVSFLRTNSVMDVLGHEVGHRWLARVRFIDEAGNRSRRLLGRQLSHWSFLFNGEGSVVQGNEILDQQDGTFLTVDATYHYSDLDLYLMGLIPASSVPELFYVESDQGAEGPRPSFSPALGVEFSGRRVDLTVDDIIAAEGPRRPDSSASKKSFNMGFALVSRPGQSPSQASIDKLERIRQRWVEFFSEATDGLAEAVTTIHPK